MEVSLHNAKTHLSRLIEAVEAGEEVVVSRRKVPVARLVPVAKVRQPRIGTLKGRPFRMGEGFDSPDDQVADDFGVPRR